MKNLLASIVISVTISLCYGSPIRNRQLYSSEELQTSKSDPQQTPPDRKVFLYQNETLGNSKSVPKRNQGKQNKDQENYYVLVVTVPETTTARPQQVAEVEPDPEVNLSFQETLKETEIPKVSIKEEVTSEAAPAPVAAEQRPAVPSLISSIGNVLIHTIRGNFSGIVDESFGSGASAPLVTVLNNLLNDSSCNTIRRLLGQCRTQGSTETGTSDSQRALLLSVII